MSSFESSTMRGSKDSFLLCMIIALSFMTSCQKKDNPLTPEVVATHLTAPTGLQIVSATETQVKLRWIDNNNAETSFIVERSTDSLNYVSGTVVGKDCDSATVTGTFLTTANYYFRVKAANADTTTGPSNVVRLTLFPPATSMQISSFTPGSVSLTWVDNSTNESGFYIEQAVDALPYSTIDSVSANVTSKVIAKSFDSSKTYAFRIVAHTADRKSAPSNALARTLGNWVYVAGGTFQMGRSDGYGDERPVHSVTLTGYYIGKYEVTVAQYRQYTDAMNLKFPTAPAGGWTDNAPMVNVTWNEAAAYCHWLDSTQGNSASLPSEAQWEFAARGGNCSQHFRYSGSNSIADIAWYYLNASGIARQGGLKLPNELGIYDMSGNVWEWCSDWLGNYVVSYPPVVNPKGATFGNERIFRGGSWFDYGLTENECRVETRYSFTPGSRAIDGGFRVVKLK